MPKPAITFGPSVSTSPSPICSICRTKSYPARQHAECPTHRAEARRAESSLHPNSMDLYFQGMACVNKGSTPEHMAQARGFFERALALDPKNIEALVGMANVDVTIGS